MASKGRSLGEFVSAAGVSTVFSQFNAENGPVLIGSANSTGTSSQALQVTGGSYFSSNIGIGTTNPLSQVQIFNTSHRYITLTGDGGSTRIMLGNRDSGGSSGPSVIDAGNRNISFGVGDSFDTGDGGNITKYLFIENGGNIGIGTDNPVSKLSVYGTVQINQGGNDNISATTPLYINSQAEGYDSASISTSRYYQYLPSGTVIALNPSSEITNTAALIDSTVYGSGGATNVYFGAVAGTGNNGPANFVVGRRTGNQSWAESLRVDTSGDVGIGTDNPGAQLEVRDSASQGIIVRSDSTQATDTNKALRVRNNSDTNTFSVSHKGQGYFGNGVGINTDNVGEGLHVRAFDGNVVPLRLRSGLDSSDNTQLRFYGAYTKSDLWTVGNRIDNGGTGRNFEIFDNVANATRFEITDNASIAMFNAGNGANGASGADDGNVLHIQGSQACLRLGPYYAGNDRDMILMRANGTDTYIRSNNERFNFYNNQGEMRFYTGTSQTDNLRLTIQAGGTVVVAGALSKGSGSFKIDHPLPGLSTSHHLVHSFVEGPRADLIYRGEVKLVSGIATIIMDEAVGITTGTWEILCRDPDVFVTNNEDWTPVKAGITSTGVLTIQAQDPTCTAKVNWLVIAERQDPHMYETDWTDENGRPILEPVKPEEVGIGTTSVGIGTTQ